MRGSRLNDSDFYAQFGVQSKSRVDSTPAESDCGDQEDFQSPDQGEVGSQPVSRKTVEHSLEGLQAEVARNMADAAAEAAENTAARKDQMRNLKARDVVRLEEGGDFEIFETECKTAIGYACNLPNGTIDDGSGSNAARWIDTMVDPILKKEVETAEKEGTKLNCAPYSIPDKLEDTVEARYMKLYSEMSVQEKFNFWERRIACQADIDAVEDEFESIRQEAGEKVLAFVARAMKMWRRGGRGYMEERRAVKTVAAGAWAYLSTQMAQARSDAGGFVEPYLTMKERLEQVTETGGVRTWIALQKFAKAHEAHLARKAREVKATHWWGQEDDSK